jgi:hypothetical protein
VLPRSLPVKLGELLEKGWWVIVLAVLIAGWYFGIIPLPV